MELSVERLDNGIKKITLRGKMDIDGSNRIALPFSTEAAVEKANVVIDLSELETPGREHGPLESTESR